MGVDSIDLSYPMEGVSVMVSIQIMLSEVYSSGPRTTVT